MPIPVTNTKDELMTLFPERYRSELPNKLQLWIGIHFAYSIEWMIDYCVIQPFTLLNTVNRFFKRWSR